jgi:hypothetical protein
MRRDNLLALSSHQTGRGRPSPNLQGRQASLWQSKPINITFIYRVFEMLGENPKFARTRAEISPPVRIHPSGSHLIVFIERDEGGVLIIRVRHYRENW